MNLTRLGNTTVYKHKHLIDEKIPPDTNLTLCRQKCEDGAQIATLPSEMAHSVCQFGTLFETPGVSIEFPFPGSFEMVGSTGLEPVAPSV